MFFLVKKRKQRYILIHDEMLLWIKFVNVFKDVLLSLARRCYSIVKTTHKLVTYFIFVTVAVTQLLLQSVVL